MGDGLATRPYPANPGSHRPERPTPRQDERLRSVRIVDLQLGDVLGDTGHLLGSEPDHAVMVLGVVTDVPGDVLLLETADPVLERRRTRDGPRPGEGRLVAGVGLEVGAVLSREVRVERRDLVDVRKQPGLGPVREVRVAEQEDRRPVLHRDPRRFERGVEAI